MFWWIALGGIAILLIILACKYLPMPENPQHSPKRVFERRIKELEDRLKTIEDEIDEIFQ
jgi:hypothetical protein